MDRALVVVDEAADAELVREAGTLAAGVDATLVVFSLLTTEEYEGDMAVLETIESAERVDRGDISGDELATKLSQNMASEALDGVDVDIELAGVVQDDDHADLILERAETYDCDHIFLTGKRRTPTGKAVFGDVAQSVVLNFEGYVTLTVN
jgi:nucleotide-binding universal stress UspA family protein